MNANLARFKWIGIILGGVSLPAYAGQYDGFWIAALIAWGVVILGVVGAIFAAVAFVVMIIMGGKMVMTKRQNSRDSNTNAPSNSSASIPCVYEETIPLDSKSAPTVRKIKRNENSNEVRITGVALIIAAVASIYYFFAEFKKGPLGWLSDLISETLFWVVIVAAAIFLLFLLIKKASGTSKKATVDSIVNHEVCELKVEGEKEEKPSIQDKNKKWLVRGCVLLAVLSFPYFARIDFAKRAPVVDKPAQLSDTEIFRDCDDAWCPEVVVIPSGSFMMNNIDEKKPGYQVNIKRFALGKTEVTQRQWKAVMGENYFKFWGNDNPIAGINWFEAKSFIKKLNDKMEKAGKGRPYRLPSEAEWEYACRAGGNHRYCGTNDYREVEPTTFFEKPHEVATMKPNALGLYDMSGNVGEWLEDCWHDSWSGSRAPEDGSAKTTGCSGGGYLYRATGKYDSSSTRSYTQQPSKGSDKLGFRLARDIH